MQLDHVVMAADSEKSMRQQALSTAEEMVVELQQKLSLIFSQKSTLHLACEHVRAKVVVILQVLSRILSENETLQRAHALVQRCSDIVGLFQALVRAQISEFGREYTACVQCLMQHLVQVCYLIQYRTQKGLCKNPSVTTRCWASSSEVLELTAGGCAGYLETYSLRRDYSIWREIPGGAQHQVFLALFRC